MVLQCAVVMATATVSDIHNAESGTVDPRDGNSGLERWWWVWGGGMEGGRSQRWDGTRKIG